MLQGTDPELELCSLVDRGTTNARAPSPLDTHAGVRLRSASFCIGDDMNTTTSQCPGGDQDEALSDASGAMDGWVRLSVDFYCFTSVLRLFRD